MRIQLSLLVLAATQIGATDCGEVLRDPGFDLWCGGDLCTWKVVRGDVRRVDTWHEGDSGVELVGTDVAIAQLSPVTSGDGTCIEFELVANVSKDAEAFLDVDVYGDGSIEHAERIPTSNWQPLSYKLRFTKPFTGIRFELTKRGTGTAVFANIGAHVVTGCEGLSEISGGPAPLGARCGVDADCESTMCRLVDDRDSLFGKAYRCVGCDATTCGADVCGVSEPISPVLAIPMRCEPAGGSELGELCVTGAECGSGICAGGACSTCDGAHPCAGGAACGPAWAFGPSVCAGLHASGEPCATDGECASGACNGGARKVCENDGRPCGNDTNCPVDAGLLPAACIAVGVTGGSCQ